MKLLALVLLVAGLQPGVAAENNTFPEKDRAALLQSAKHVKMIGKKEIPPEVLLACREVSKDFTLAGPKEDYQSTDVISGISRLPSRRLVWAGRVSNYCVLHYQRGGFAPRSCLVVTSVVKAGVEARIVWSGYTKNNRLIEFADFVAGLMAGEFKESNARL